MGLFEFIPLFGEWEYDSGGCIPSLLLVIADISVVFGRTVFILCCCFRQSVPT